jgi:glycosyltransferase involved in cell wall biosynthesis
MLTSVIIPTYNRWPVVARAVESVLNQTRQAAQILVVDDGSDDGTTVKLKRRFGSEITVVEQANHGVSHARNTAINLAQGDWIALLDSDDEWLPQKLQRQHDAIENADSPVLIHCDEIWVRNGIRVNAAKKHQKRGGFIYEYCLPLCCISPSAAMIRKSTLTALGGFDDQLPACEDYDLWLRLCAEHPVVYIDEPLLIKYGGHDDQLSAKYWGMDRFRLVALEKILASDSLNKTQRQQTTDMLIRKARIMLKGAVKHNNHAVIERCNQLIAHYDKL